MGSIRTPGCSPDQPSEHSRGTDGCSSGPPSSERRDWPPLATARGLCNANVGDATAGDRLLPRAAAKGHDGRDVGVKAGIRLTVDGDIEPTRRVMKGHGIMPRLRPPRRGLGKEQHSPCRTVPQRWFATVGDLVIPSSGPDIVGDILMNEGLPNPGDSEPKDPESKLRRECGPSHCGCALHGCENEGRVGPIIVDRLSHGEDAAVEPAFVCSTLPRSKCGNPNLEAVGFVYALS